MLQLWFACDLSHSDHLCLMCMCFILTILQFSSIRQVPDSHSCRSSALLFKSIPFLLLAISLEPFDRFLQIFYQNDQQNVSVPAIYSIFVPVLGRSLQVSIPILLLTISFEPLDRFLQFFHQNSQQNISVPFSYSPFVPVLGPSLQVSIPILLLAISFEPLDGFFRFFSPKWSAKWWASND